MTTLVDSNVILDVVTEDADWMDWSASMLAEAAQQGRLVINPIIYAEVACGFTNVEDLDSALPPDYFTREPCRGQLDSSRPEHFSRTAVAGAVVRAPCRTSSSAPTLRWPATRC